MQTSHDPLRLHKREVLQVQQTQNKSRRLHTLIIMRNACIKEISNNVCPCALKSSLDTGSGSSSHGGAELLHGGPGQEPLPPRLDVRVRVEERRVRRRHEVEGVREVVQVREADEVPRQIRVLAQARLVDVQHLPQLLQALVHHPLVGGDPAHGRVDEALVDDRRQRRVVLVRLHFRPHVHHGRLLEVAFAQEVGG